MTGKTTTNNTIRVSGTHPIENVAVTKTHINQMRMRWLSRRMKMKIRMTKIRTLTASEDEHETQTVDR